MKTDFRSLVFLMLMVASNGAASADGETIRFAAEPYPPFVIDEAGKAGGALVEVMQRTCAIAKRICTVEIMPFRRSLAMAMLGVRFDGIMPSMRVPEREQAFVFSLPIAKSAYSFFVPVKSAWKFRSSADLNDMTIAVYGPSITSNALQQAAANTTAKIEIELDNLTALRKLIAGRYGERAAVVLSQDAGMYLLNQERISELKQAGVLKPIEYGFALSRNSPRMAQLPVLDDALRELRKSGELKSILGKYGLRAG